MVPLDCCARMFQAMRVANTNHLQIDLDVGTIPRCKLELISWLQVSSGVPVMLVRCVREFAREGAKLTGGQSSFAFFMPDFFWSFAGFFQRDLKAACSRVSIDKWRSRSHQSKVVILNGRVNSRVEMRSSFARCCWPASRTLDEFISIARREVGIRRANKPQRLRPVQTDQPQVFPHEGSCMQLLRCPPWFACGRCNNLPARSLSFGQLDAIIFIGKHPPL